MIRKQMINSEKTIFKLHELLEEKEILNLKFKKKVTINLVDNIALARLDIKWTNITFKGCNFHDGVKITFNSESVSNEIEPILKLNFDNCIVNPQLQNGIVLSDLECINIDKRNTVRFHLSFTSCFINIFTLHNSSFNNLSFFSCIFSNALHIFNCKIKNISIKNSFGGFLISHCSESNLNVEYENSDLVFSNENLKVFIEDTCKKEDILAIFYFKTYFNLQKVLSISIKFNSKKPSKNENEVILATNNNSLIYKINESDFDNFNISLEVLFHDMLNLPIESKVDLSIDKAIFKKIRLYGKSESIIKFEDVKSNSIFFHNLHIGKMELFNIQSIGKDSIFLIVNSELINTWFNKVNLKSFKIVSIYRSTIEDIRFTATEFPVEIESNVYRMIPSKGDFVFNKNLDSYDEPYENYRQLKSSLLKSDYVVKALEMHQKMYDAIKNSKNISSEDRIILRLNSISNKHATSIKQAFCLSFSLILIFHFLNIIAMPNAPYEWGWVNFKSFSISIIKTITFAFQHFEKAFIIANPIHRLDELKISHGELSLGNYSVSYFSRLLIGWGYYQFIMAFRKFGKTY